MFPARHCELNGPEARQLVATLRRRHRGATVERAHHVIRPIFAGLIGPGVLLIRAPRGMLEPRTNAAAHHPPHPLGDLAVAKFGVSAVNNSTNIYLLGAA